MMFCVRVSPSKNTPMTRKVIPTPRKNFRTFCVVSPLSDS